jgi:hypothetical protein
MLADLIKNHAAALQRWLNSVPAEENLPGEGKVYDAFIDAEWELISYQCQTADEVQRKIAYAAECQSFAEAVTSQGFDEFIKSIQLPAVRQEVSPAVAESISKWQVAEDAFRTFCNASTDLKKDEAKADELYDVQTAAEDRLIAEPCNTLADVQAKAAIVMRHEGIFESVTNGMVDGEHVMRLFLRSIVGGGESVDFGGN